MSNTAKKEKHEQQQQVVESPHLTGALLPIGLSLDTLIADAGAGSEEITSSDLSTPIISILQANSPQCKRSDGKYIPGAKEGMLYNNVTNELYDGDEGIVVLPCMFSKQFIEWKPNRSGLVAVHDKNTDLRNQVVITKNAEGKETPTLPNGNSLIETNQHVVLIISPDGSLIPAVIPMTSSALRSSRIWNTRMKQLTIKDSSGKSFNPATYYTRYKLTTAAKTKDQYSWFTWNIEPVGPVETGEQYNAGAELCKLVSSGALKVKQEPQEDGGVSHSALSDDDEIPFS